MFIAISMDNFSVIAERLVHLVCLKEFDEFQKFFVFGWDTLGGVPADHKTILKFSVRSYRYLDRYLEFLSYVDVARNGCSASVALVQYMVTTLKALDRALCSFKRLFKIGLRKGLDLNKDQYRSYYPIFVLSGDAHKLIKYQTCFYWNRHLCSLETEYPEAGPFRDLPLFIIDRETTVFTQREKNNRFYNYSLFMGLKKSLPPLCPVQMEDNFNSLREDLTALPEVSLDRYSNLRRYCEELCSEMRGCAKEIVLSNTASFGASFYSGRAQLGQWGEIKRMYCKYHVWKDPRLPDHADWDSVTPLFRGWLFEEGKLTSIYEPGPDDVSVWEWFHNLKAADCSVDEWKGVGKVKPHGILEPLKVRIITKGDSMTLAGLHPVKDLLRLIMRKVPGNVFELAFGSIEDQSSDIWNFHSKDSGGIKTFMQRWKENEDFEFVSGDFSAATNKINGEISLYVLQTILQTLEVPQEIQDRCYRSMLNCEIHYSRDQIPVESYGLPPFPKGYNPVEKYEQTNGQLMGSVISFPILCLVNLMCFWEAYETRENRKVSLAELTKMNPLRINGDDILFIGSRYLYRCWEEAIPHYGFVKSLGKNLVLRNAFTINSVYYTVEEDASVRIQNYVNCGFLNGVKKGDGANDTVSRATQLGSSFDEYVHSYEFWTSASEGLRRLNEIDCPGVKNRAINLYFETYLPYLEAQGWTRNEWELNHLLTRLLTSETPKGYTVSTYHMPEKAWMVVLDSDFRKDERHCDVQQRLFDKFSLKLDDVYKKVKKGTILPPPKAIITACNFISPIKEGRLSLSASGNRGEYRGSWRIR